MQVQHPGRTEELCCDIRIPLVVSLGAWADNVCEWRCNEGRFPEVPGGVYLDMIEGEAICATGGGCFEQPCLTCSLLLAKLDIAIDPGITINPLEQPTKCTATLTASYDLSYIALAAFTSEVPSFILFFITLETGPSP